MVVPDFDTGLLPLGWPAEGPVISTFGHRRSGWHGGINIKATLGTPVQAAAAGVPGLSVGESWAVGTLRVATLPRTPMP